jgi:hypothetical protein
MQLVQNVIDAESPVDLVVLMGQTVDPDYEDAYSNRFEDAVAYLKLKEIPWVSTGAIDLPNNAITRDYMCKRDKEIGAEGNLSWTGKYNKNSSYGIYT